MRQPTDVARLRSFMQQLGRAADGECRLYFTGGATAVLMGWRDTTIDADIRVIPESDAVYRAIPRLKESLQINVELASPSDFIPELPDWQARSLFIAREGRIDFHHYDLYAQALAKVERGHALDRQDVREMLERKLIDPGKALALFRAIEPRLYRYPALDPASFRRAVEEMFI